jgi:hypothetical protein
MWNHFAPVCLLNALANSLTEPLVLFNHSQGGILYQLFGVVANMEGDPGDLRLLLGRETNFHALKKR